MQGAFFIDNIKDRVAISLDSGCDMVLICNHPKMVAEIIDIDWGMSKKLQSMQGYKNFNYDTITHSNHLEKIRDLL
jgi:beta-N-acetylhexosaminidase